MSEKAGRIASISIVGNAVALLGEACTDISELQDGTKWQITDLSKRIIDKNTTVSIFESIGTDTAEADTTTTTIKITAHGLVNGDMIINTTRANAKRVVTKVDADTLTVSSVTGQTSGDSIILLDKSVGFTVNHINGIINYEASGDVYVSGAYLPKTLVATAYDYSYNQASDMGDVTPFLATHKKRIPLEKYCSGTLSYWDITDEYFTDALLADTPKYIVLADGTSQKALLAYFDKTELKASIGSPQNMTIGFINANEEVG